MVELYGTVVYYKQAPLETVGRWHYYEILDNRDKHYLDEVYYHLYLHDGILKKLGNENLGISKMKDELLRVIMFHLRDMLKPRVSSRNYIRSRYRILINDDDNDEDDNIF